MPRGNYEARLKLFTDENAAREFFESKRWKNGRHCPHCGGCETFSLKAREGSKSPVRPGVYKCSSCRKQFTARIGTIFEDSKLPIRVWLRAIFEMCDAKHGVSAHELSRKLQITVKSAWFVAHRLREAMKLQPMAGMLGGTVEADETFVGGKPRNPGTSKRGRGTEKTPVLVLVEREGKARCTPMDRVGHNDLRREVESVVSRNACLVTDEYGGYIGMSIGNAAVAEHRTVKHRAREYARREADLVVHTNTAESFFAKLKRAHYGVFHHYSKNHVSKYATEMEFRWNHRKLAAEPFADAVVEGAKGRRLLYRVPVKKTKKPDGES